MTMNSYVIDDHLRGVVFHSKKLADQVELKQLLEHNTGLSFSTYLSDRKAAYRLKMAVRDWVSEYCQTYLKRFPYKEAEMTYKEVLALATNGVYWHLVCQEYGEDRINAAVNSIGENDVLRKEFFAEGDAASSRDFSYLLDAVDN